ncbi:zinc ribbon domain-containing protein [Sporolactobacillus sp. CPB3-1]|uniref:Zinc ribbon domain-containing protein n=1 Tax=Sporolactobacillus mangiferae TaxID=2940498 RepID=A0ABT0MDL7_9BACL|nr:zinc ribbon domain-containing protein [Sporolactobacillus mangiferae]MCL1632768.1 zinc ribbon domain-containing protein [Sporolactobacillus mangiferae]
MKCSKCGTENDEHAKFCRNCGQLLNVESSESTSRVQEETAAATSAKGGLTISTGGFSEFWTYVKEALRTPGSYDNQLKNGIISLILFSVLLPISIVHALNQLVHNLSSSIGGSLGLGSIASTAFDNSKILGVETTVKWIIALAASLAFYALIMYLCLKVAKADVSYSTIIEEFGSMSVPLFVGSVLLFLLSYLNLNLFFGALVIVSIGVQVMFFFTMYKLSKEAVLDPFYLALICHSVYNIVIYFALKSYIWSLISNISNIPGF